MIVVKEDALPRSSAEAKALGAKFYFTGLPCRRGHTAPRYTHGSCTACKEEDRIRKASENAAYFRQWRKDNPEKCKKYHAEAKASGKTRIWIDARKEYANAKARSRRLANLERARAVGRFFYAKHAEKRRQDRRSYYLANKDELRAQGRARRAANKEAVASANRAWRLNNPEKARASDRTKKAKRRGAVGKITAMDISRLMKLQRKRCAWCKTSIASEFHCDHIQPLSKGGSNTPANAQLLCPPCNMRKHASDPIDFARREGRLL